MANIILVTGGTRSGKSSYALQLAENEAAPHCFIATCGVSDPEMAERVKKHQDERSGNMWKTVEETHNLLSAFTENINYSFSLVDCLTLWISNVMERCHHASTSCEENDIKREIDQLFAYLKKIDATVVFVTNEIGMGIVPENRLARRYRDLVGYCNRIVASRADDVVLVSCGLPLYLKKTLLGTS